MEQRLGHDFADVRIHTGDSAARSAEAVQAEAFTVGRHVVFGAGQYAPESQAGRRLLLHELTHAAQFGTHTQTPSGPLRVSSPDEPGEQHAAAVANSSSPAVSESPPASVQTLHRAAPMTATEHRRHTGLLPYREATSYARCMEIMGDSQYCNEEVLDIPAITPAPQTCVPTRVLTWADFSGTPPAGSTFHALTSFSFGSRTSGGREWIVATFNGASSWVRPRAANPGDRTQNGCAPCHAL